MTSSSLSRSIRCTIEPSSALGLPRRSCEASGSSSIRSSSIASRSEARHGRRERVDAGLERLVAQQPRAERLERRDRQLLVARRHAPLDPLAQVVGRGGGERQRQDRVRRRALLDEPREALDQRVRLAGPGAGEDQQRAAGVGDRLELRGALLDHGHLRRIRRVSALAADWLGAARAATEELRSVLAAAPTTAQRARETGTRGEGGDRTLEIDAAAEDGRVPAARAAARARAHRFTAVSEERGRVDFGFDPRDRCSSSSTRSTARATPSAACRTTRSRSRSPTGRRWPTSCSASCTTSGPTRSGSRGAARAPCSTARGWIPASAERRVGGKLELLGIESADPRWVRESAEALAAVGAPPARDRRDRRLALPGRGRAARRHGHAAPLPRGRRRGGAADRPRGAAARSRSRPARSRSARRLT